MADLGKTTGRHQVARNPRDLSDQCGVDLGHLAKPAQAGVKNYSRSVRRRRDRNHGLADPFDRLRPRHQKDLSTADAARKFEILCMRGFDCRVGPSSKFYRPGARTIVRHYSVAEHNAAFYRMLQRIVSAP